MLGRGCGTFSVFLNSLPLPSLLSLSLHQWNLTVNCAVSLKGYYVTRLISLVDCAIESVYSPFLVLIFSQTKAAMESPSTKMERPASLPSPNGQGYLSIPSPIITRRTRTNSTSQRAYSNPIDKGTVKTFCREKGHGFIEKEKTKEIIFVHISDIEGEYVPLPGDTVRFRICPVPPKMEKVQAVHVEIVNFTPEVHHKWDCP